MIIKDSLWVEDRTRTGDIQNHNLKILEGLFLIKNVLFYSLIMFVE